MNFNRRGGIYLLPLLKTWSKNIVAAIKSLSEQETEVNGWSTSLAIPKIVRLCDEPDNLVQPASPALTITYQGKDVVTPAIMYNYPLTVSYVYASPVEREWGDDALFACMLASEAIYQAAKEARPAGIYSLNWAGDNVSPLMTTTGTTPLLSRILTVNINAQMEEDF